MSLLKRFIHRRTEVAVSTLTIVVVLAGCQYEDTRISVNEFVEMDRNAFQETAAAPRSEQASRLWRQRAFVPFRIGPFDELSITIHGLYPQTALPTVIPARVDQEGDIVLPMTGAVKVTGMTLVEAEQAIRSAYVPSRIKDAISVNVKVTEYDATKVLVVGAVRNPGIVPLPRTSRDVLHAVAASGGLATTGSGPSTVPASGKVTLRRVQRPEEVVTLNLLDPVELEAAFALEPLQSGDILTVESAEANTIFVGGLVMAPGPKQFPAGARMNLLQVLSAAGGRRPDLMPPEATLIRHMPDGSDVRVRVDLNRLETLEEQNIYLAAGDILWVPHTQDTRLREFIQNNFFFRGGVNMTYSVSGIEYFNRPGQQSGGGGGSTLQDSFDPFGFFFP